MRYFETEFYNREEKEMVIRPVENPIMLRFSQSHYGYEINVYLKVILQDLMWKVLKIIIIFTIGNRKKIIIQFLMDIIFQ